MLRHTARENTAVNETTQQYMNRITGYVRGKDHVKVLRSTVRALKILLKGGTAAKIKKRPAPGRWSVAEILAHVAESELVFGYRLRMVLMSGGITIQAFDQNAWQRNAGYLNNNPKKAFNLFETLRENNIALLQSISPEQWDQHGMHEERGKETVRRMVEMFAGHDINHLRQIENILRPKR
jgi:hypothetical protein